MERGAGSVDGDARPSRPKGVGKPSEQHARRDAVPTAGFLIPEAANPPRHWLAVSKGSSCHRQLAVPSSWMYSMNSATVLPSGNVMASALRIRL